MSHNTSPQNLQEASLEDITVFELNFSRGDLIIEADPELENKVQLISEPVKHAPDLQGNGTKIQISQSGRYRGRVAPVLKVPTSDLPQFKAHQSKGSFTFEGVNADIVARLSRGNLRINRGYGSIDCVNSDGDVQISDHQGALKCRLSKGDLLLARCSGPLEASLSKGDLLATECESSLTAQLSKGDAIIQRPIEQAIAITSSKGDVVLKDGSVSALNFRLSGGDVVSKTRLLFSSEAAPAEPIDPADVETSPIDLDDVENGDNVRFNMGGIQFQAGDQGVRISREGTDIVRAGAEGLEIRKSDGSEIFVASDSGVGIGPKNKGKEQFKFVTSKGDISVQIPDDQPARVELIVNSGDATSDIPLVEVGRPGPKGSTRRFVGVSGGSDDDRILLRAKTGSGDISVRTVPMATSSGAPVSGEEELPSSEERTRKVLDALAKGDISIEEADMLIAAIEREG